jgi:hypothetical protein
MIAPRHFFVACPDWTNKIPYRWLVIGFDRKFHAEGCIPCDNKAEAMRLLKDRNQYCYREMLKNKRRKAKKARPAPKSAPKESEEAQKHLTTSQVSPCRSINECNYVNDPSQCPLPEVCARKGTAHVG